MLMVAVRSALDMSHGLHLGAATKYLHSYHSLKKPWLHSPNPNTGPDYCTYTYSLLSVSLFSHVYIHIYIRFISIYIYLYHSLYIYLYIYVCMYIYIYMYVCIYINVCIYICIYIYIWRMPVPSHGLHPSLTEELQVQGQPQRRHPGESKRALLLNAWGLRGCCRLLPCIGCPFCRCPYKSPGI